MLSACSYTSCMRFFISLPPVALPRPRVTKNKRVYYTNPWKGYHRKAVAQLRIKYPDEYVAAPCHIHVVYQLPAPKNRPSAAIHRSMYDLLKDPSTHRYPYPCKPDIDNLLKGTMDILQTAGILKDDNLVVFTSAQKYATTLEARIGTEITIDLV